MERDGTHQGFWLGPSLIDGSFQASMALADAATGIGTLKIPLSIRRLQPMGRAFNISTWSYFELIDYSDRNTIFRSWLLNDAGEALVYFDHVHLQEVRDEHIQKVLAASGRQGAEQKTMYNVEWNDLGSPAATLDASSRWLILGGAEAVATLGLDKNKQFDIHKHGKTKGCEDLLAGDTLKKILEDAKRYTGVVFVGGMDAKATDVDVLELALRVVQVLAKDPSKAPPLSFVTCGAQARASSGDDAKKGSPTHSGLWGFARAVRMNIQETSRLHAWTLIQRRPKPKWALCS
jgi:hypothetical protein